MAMAKSAVVDEPNRVGGTPLDDMDQALERHGRVPVVPYNVREHHQHFAVAFAFWHSWQSDNCDTAGSAKGTVCAVPDPPSPPTIDPMRLSEQDRWCAGLVRSRRLKNWMCSRR